MQQDVEAVAMVNSWDYTSFAGETFGIITSISFPVQKHADENKQVQQKQNPSEGKQYMQIPEAVSLGWLYGFLRCTIMSGFKRESRKVYVCVLFAPEDQSELSEGR